MRRSGFTLLEVLIAFVIAALALGVMFEATLGGLGAAADAGNVIEALTLARSRLALAGYALSTGAASPGTQSGGEGRGFRWTVTIAQAAQVTLPTAPGQGLRGVIGLPATRPRAALYAITATVSWPGASVPHQVRLATARLVRRGAAAPAS